MRRAIYGEKEEMTETRRRSPARTHTVPNSEQLLNNSHVLHDTTIHSIVGDLVWAAIITVSTVYEQHVGVCFYCM